ncbi:MAG: DUF2726 domain-containing protein [bacterium]|nr:DUF2726 domain-containing protein [bacterium]
MIEGLHLVLLLGAMTLAFQGGGRIARLKRDLHYRRATRGEIRTSTFRPSSGELPYFRRRFLCSDGEFRFYRELVAALEGEWDVWPKIRVAAIIGCRRDDWAAGYGAPIAQKEFDFVVVRPGTSHALAAIELDDCSHALPHRKNRDEFLDRACSSAGLPLLRVKVQRRYDRAVLREALLRAGA